MSRFTDVGSRCLAHSSRASVAVHARKAFAAVSTRRLRLLALLAVCVLGAPFFRDARADNGAASAEVAHVTLQTNAKNTATGSESSLVVSGWQGAKNYQESFAVSVSGGYSGGKLRFLTSNCRVSPETGTVDDAYTVTVTGAGTYSMTAILSGDETHGGNIRIVQRRRGQGGSGAARHHRLRKRARLLPDVHRPGIRRHHKGQGSL